MAKHAQSIDRSINTRIRGHGRGWVFTPTDFLDLGSRTAVSTTLKRLKAAGTIRAIDRGLYDYPRQDASLGTLSPTTDTIADALKGRDDLRLQPSGAHAANLLGLSEQVPVRTVFLTNGRARKVQLGKRQIILKGTTSRQMATAGRISGLVIQALRWIGKRNINAATIDLLRQRLTAQDKQQLMKDLRYAPTWVAEVMRQVAQSTP